MRTESLVKKYVFSWNGRTKVIEASTSDEAKSIFMKRFGFWPDKNLVDTQILEEDL